MTAPIEQVISPEELAEIGQALFGNQWQSALARELGISGRSMRYLAAGNRPFHQGFAKDLVGILGTRGTELRRLAKTLRKRVE